jgi:hypothetical protein
MLTKNDNAYIIRIMNLQTAHFNTRRRTRISG